MKMEVQTVQILLFITNLFVYKINLFLGNKYYCFLIFLRNYYNAKIIILEELYKIFPKYKEKVLLRLEYANQHISTRNKSIRLLKSKLRQKKIRKDNNFFQKLKYMSIVTVKNLSKEQVNILLIHQLKTIMNYIYKMRNHGLFSLLTKPVLKKVPHNKKSIDMIRLLWDLHDRNPADGKMKLSLKMALMGRFISPNTIKKYLSDPRPSVPKKKKKNKKYDDSSANGNNINAKYPNHTWNIDFTCVRLFFTYIYVFFVIDIYSRKIIYFDISKYNPDIDWVIQRMKNACAEIWSNPKHLIADYGEQFKYKFETFCDNYNINLRHGKAHSWRSNVYIERFHQTIKYEALNNLFIFTMYYLRKMIKSFLDYYNNFRPHQSLDGMTPSMVYEGKKKLELIDPKGKKIIKKKFCDGLITAFYLEKAA